MIANIVVLAIVAILMILAIRKIVSDHKKGIGSCGHPCSSCPSHGKCNCK